MDSPIAPIHDGKQSGKRGVSSNGNSTEDLNVPLILMKKRDKQELSRSEIQDLVNAVRNQSMEDAQLGAFLAFVYLNGLTSEETANFTEAMKYSGDVFKWPSDWIAVDKHSTGGVGDKVSLILAPALASCGLKVPMISGRGLGHTGGTLDKLESIPGFKVALSTSEIKVCLESVGCCIVGQTEALVPADRRMYSIRDVTATVNSTPLIVSSIISKKACESLDSLVLDVKFGSGALIKSEIEAKKLGSALVDAGHGVGIKTSALVTCNDAPIGKKIGNALEVEESVECLRNGDCAKALQELVVSLGGELLFRSGKVMNLSDGEERITQSLKNGTALETFGRMLIAQGVDKRTVSRLCGKEFDVSCLPQSKMITPLYAPKKGVIDKIDAFSIAEICLQLGAGRMTTSDKINPSVGIVLHKCVGEEISTQDVWAEIRHDSLLSEQIINKAKSALQIVPPENSRKPTKLIVERIRK